MVSQLILMSFLLIIAPLMPWIFIPAVYSLVGMLLLQNVSLIAIVGVFIFFSTISVVILRYVEGYLLDKIEEHQKEEKYNDFLSRSIDKIKLYVQDKKISRGWSKLKRHLESDEGQLTLFFLAIIGFAPTIPDILTVALLRRRLRFGYFVLAVIIGKTIHAIPLILVGTGIVKYFG